MAIIKAGTYRFNNVLTVPSKAFSENVNFITDTLFLGNTYTVSCNYIEMYNGNGDSVQLIYGVVSSVPSLEDLGISFPFSAGVYDDEWTDTYGIGVEVITVTADTEVTEEFATWFTTNAVEVVEGKQISGKWKFNDVLTKPTFNLLERVQFTSPYRIGDVYGYNTYLGFKESTRNSEDIGLYFLQYEDNNSGPIVYSSQEEQAWLHWDDSEKMWDDYQSIDFGTELQTVSAEFYEWFTANAEERKSISVKYSNRTIAMLDAGQKATLNCAGMNMATDVVVEIAEDIGGGSGGGGAEFNIAYGESEPTDTSKLWVKASEPAEVNVTTAIVTTSEEFEPNFYNLPTAAYGIASARVGTKVYLFGGCTGNSTYSKTIDVFDTETNSITTLSTTLPKIGEGIATAVVGTKVYLFGGSSNSYFNTIDVFDTETNSIETLSTTLPSVRTYIATAVVGTKVYLFGGTKGDTSSSNHLASISVFDTETNAIETLNTISLPAKAGGIATAVVGTKVYLFGGNTGVSSSNSYLNTINVFDTETNSIETLSTTLPETAGYIAAAVVGTKVYLFGGRYGNYGYKKTIYIFDTFFALPTNTMLIEATIGKNLVNLMPNIELGINNVYIGNADGNGERVAAALYKDGAWTEI